MGKGSNLQAEPPRIRLYGVPPREVMLTRFITLFVSKIPYLISMEVELKEPIVLAESSLILF